MFSFPMRGDGREMNEVQGKTGDPRSMSTGNTYHFPLSSTKAIEENKDEGLFAPLLLQNIILNYGCGPVIVTGSL